MRITIDAHTRATYGGESGGVARIEIEARTFSPPRYAGQQPGVNINVWTEQGRVALSVSADEFRHLAAGAESLLAETERSWEAAAAISPAPVVKP